MEQKNKHRITKVAKEFGVGVSTLIDFLKNQGLSKLNPNSKINENFYQKALKEFGDEKLIKEKIRKQKEDEALIHKRTISIDDLDKKDDDEKIEADEESDEILIQDESKIIDEPEKKDDNKKKEEKEKQLKQKQKEKKDKEKSIDEPKILGKINLDEVDKNKDKKKKTEKKKQEQTKKDEPKKQEISDKQKQKDTEKNKEKLLEKQEKSKKEIKEKQKTEKSEKEDKKQEDKTKKKEKDISEKQKQEKPKKQDKDLQETTKKQKQEKSKKEEVKKQDKNKEEELKKTEKKKQSKENQEDNDKLKGPKVVGKIDLNSMNLKTRPEKKSKKEKEEERKKRKLEQQKKAKKSKSYKNKKKNKDKRKKRVEKVEINKEGKVLNNDKKNTKRKKRQRVKKKKKKDAVITDQADVQKEVRETLQKLEQRKKSKAAKFRRQKRKEHKKRVDQEIEKKAAESKVLKLTEFITVKELASLMNIEPTKIIELCFDLGQPVTINYRLNSELINMITDEFKFTVEYVQSSFEEEIEETLQKKENQVVPRPPIITVMGHVDHGKTSLLDYIRETNVVGQESGGITQHIGAYSVNVENNKIITFIDTPGHEAFTAMRARGTKVTDIAVIIIAADDKIMPQTEEAIDHASAAGVPMIFAINKIDKNGADPKRIKQQLAERNLLVEDWGGKYGCVEISAKKGIGIEDLLERILLEAEILELKADPDTNAIASVLEARLDKGRGYIANLIVRTGTLKVGDIIVAGAYYGKVKALFNERNQRVQKVGPSFPIQILGLNGAPEPGDPLVAMETEKEAREKAEQRLQIIRELEMRARKKHSLEDISKRLAEGEKMDLNFIVKADVKGSADAITDQIQKLSNQEVNVNVIRSAVGQISDNDVMLAAASNTIIIGFNVRPSLSARKLAEKKNIEIRDYSIIYDIINEVKAAVQGMLKPDIKEKILGSAEVLNVFKISKVGTVAGSLVRDGVIENNAKARVVRDGIVVYTGNIESLKRFKNDVKEVQKGYECGIGIEKFNDVKVGDFIEAFKEVEVQRKL